MNKSIIIIIIILSALAIILTLVSSPNSQMPSAEDQSSRIQMEETELLTELKDLPGVEVTELSAVDGSNSFGTAYRLTMDGITRHSAALRLPIPPANTVYEGWLLQPQSSELISTGIVERDRDGTDEPSDLRKWKLNFRGDKDYSTYTTVIITLETEVDETPEKHILEGSF